MSRLLSTTDCHIRRGWTCKRAVAARWMLCSMLMVALSVVRVFAADETDNSAPLIGAAIGAPGAFVLVEDGRFNDLPAPNLFNDKSAFAAVRLRVNEKAGLYHAAKYKVSVTLSIETWTQPGTPTTTTTALMVEYDPAPGKKHQDQNVFRIPGAHKVKATVMSLTAVDENNAPLPDVPGDVVLDAYVTVERYYIFATNVAPVLQNVSATTIAPGQGRVEITWAPLAGAEEYDFEWTIVGAEGADATTIVPASSVGYDFRYSASRITTAETKYSLNLVFEKAYVVFRIRGVGRHVSNPDQRIEGAWSLANPSGMVAGATSSGHTFDTEFHEPGLNWRYVATYAEEGKRKEVVEYYDGTLRKRQAITLLSTTNRTVVAESVPDNQGRMAVEILPAPTPQAQGNADAYFRFFRNFNLDASANKAYSRVDFDVAPGQCVAPPDALATLSGAGNYYSSSNPQHQQGMNAFIPSGGGYPFVQTTFTLDNTGRIRSQSGAGPDHKITSNHETKYYYGTPFQEDLDRLFGAYVGYNVHYKKNMTVDPNQQVSIAYLDPAGRTIATALAGNAPANLQALPSNTGGALREVDLLRNNRITPTESIALNTHLVTGTNVVHSFSYQLEPLRFTDTCVPNDCFDCVYDLTLSLQDECGTQLHPNGGITELIGAPIDLECNATSSVSRTFQKTMSIGSYPIAKRVRLNDSAVQRYLDFFIAKNKCLKTLDDFLGSYLSNVDYSGCGGDYCTVECQGELTEEVSQQKGRGGTTYQSPYQKCISDCETLDPCEAELDILLADVRPGGQYGDTTYDDNTGMTGDFLSVFNKYNNLTGVGPYFPKSMGSNGVPIMYQLGDHSWTNPSLVYRDEYGKPSMVVNSAGTLVRPQDLSFEEFMANWKDSWAEALVVFHPEYCFYQWCTQNDASNSYDSKMFATNTYDEAAAAGFLPYPNSNDPYFKAGGKGFPLDAATMSEWLAPTNANGVLQGVSLQQLAVVIVHCGKCPPLPTDPLENLAAIVACMNSHQFAQNPETKDEEWEAYRTLYQAVKQMMVEARRRSDVLAEASLAGCSFWIPAIETASEWPIPYQAQFIRDADVSPFKEFNTIATILYRTKTRRFQSVAESFDDIDPPASATEEDAEQGIEDECASQCESYADAWMMKLAPCNIGQANWASISAQIRAELINVCKSGCDQFNMYGANSTPPGGEANGITDDSFEKVLQRHLGPNYRTEACDSRLLGMPMEYGHNYSGTTPDPDACGMDGTGGVGGVVRGTTCLPCDTIAARYAEFVERDPKPAGGGNGYHFEKFAYEMNTCYSFNLTWIDYVEYMKRCRDSGTVVRCDSLTDAGRELGILLNDIAQTDGGLTRRRLTVAGNPDVGFDGTTVASLLAAKAFECTSVAYVTCEDTPHPFVCDPTHLHISLKGNKVPDDPTKNCHCDIDLTLPNGPYSFADIASLSGIRPDPADVNDDGVSHGFFITATMKNGSTVQVHGHSDCFPIGKCVRSKRPCIEDLIDIDDAVLSDAKEPVRPDLPTRIPPQPSPRPRAPQPTPSPARPIPASTKTWRKNVQVSPNSRYVFTAFVGTQGGSTKTIVAPTLKIDGVSVPLRLIPAMRAGERGQIEATWRSGDRTTATFELQGPSSVILANISLHSLDCYPKLCNKPLYETPTPPDPCREMLQAQAIFNATREYERYIDSVKQDFRRRYVSACMNLKGREKFTMEYIENEYHYTLYIYDQAGNLTQTIPPAGVVPLTSPAALQQATAHREDYKNPAKPAPVLQHTLRTGYLYNSLNQLVAQSTPDAGATRFWYDRLGRLAVSQSARQAPSNLYSYTKFDVLGRIIEVGQVKNATAITQMISRTDNLLTNWIAAGVRTEITRTQYDNSIDPSLGQQNLRGRVASTTYLENEPSHRSATYFSYDVHGNVNWLVQENLDMPAGHTRKRIDYRYDLISGNVNAVDYQAGALDAFHHRYDYDSDNRIIRVHTSPDSVIWDRDAEYTYYLHGPLARTVLGDANVQGIDYAYTIQGWIKGVNSNTLQPIHDIGGDGDASVNPDRAMVARDEFGYSLSYFAGDYTAIGGSSFEATAPSGAMNAAGPDLYNGNIRQMVTAIGSFMQDNASPLATAYKYDQLNRLVEMNAFNDLVLASNSWGGAPAPDDYHTKLTYDPNGNILTHMRNGGGASTGGGPTAMDDMTYHYTPGTNRLDHVSDVVSSTNYSDDIDDQGAGNYKYDFSGNLIKDVAEGIDEIQWMANGKIKSVRKGTKFIEFRYDPAGNRIEERVGTVTTRYYVSDAEGHLLASYVMNGSSFHVDGQLINGKNRLGRHHGELGSALPSTPNHLSRNRGNRQYELVNHLGNVLSVSTDRTIPVVAPGTATVSRWASDVAHATDYSAFGATMPGRSISSIGDYQFGFNGQEKDNEVAGNWYVFKFRICDSRLGRFLTVDPLARKYPYYAPYQFGANNPVLAIDLEGLESKDDKNPTAKQTPKAKITTEKDDPVGAGAMPSFADIAGTAAATTETTLNGLGDKWHFTRNGKFKPKGVNAPGPARNPFSKSAKIAKIAGDVLDYGQLAYHAYQYWDASGAGDAGKVKEAKKSIGVDVLSIGLGEINPVLGVMPFLHEYYTNDREFVWTMHNSFTREANAADAKQWQVDRAAEYDKENWEILFGEKYYNKTIIIGGKSVEIRDQRLFVGPPK